jgi:hypothetical protein
MRATSIAAVSVAAISVLAVILICGGATAGRSACRATQGAATPEAAKGTSGCGGQNEAPACGSPMRPPKGECTVTASGPIEVPFRVFRNHVLIPVSVNGSPPLDVVLDTGMPVPGIMLHPGPEVDAIEFDTDGAPQVVVAGAGGDGVERVAMNVTFELPGVAFTGQMAIVGPRCGPGAGSEEEAKGVVGLSIFDNFVVTFDHDRNVLVLTAPDEFEYDGPGTRLPLTIGQPPVPEVECVLETGGKRVTVSMVVDTGATYPLSITLRPEGTIEPPPEARGLVLGYSYWGELTGLVGRVEELHLGGLSLDDVITVYLEGGAPGVPPCGDDGLLGNQALRHFNATFDYARKELILERSTRTDDPFEYNMSGAAFERTDDGDFVLLKVFPDTPASEAGLSESDVVTAVNGRSARDISSEELRSMLERDGTTMALRLIRDATEMDVKLKLRRLV